MTLENLNHFSQIIIAICTIIIVVIAIVGLKEYLTYVVFVEKTRKDWMRIAEYMIEHPHLVLTYANENSREILKNRTENELREYAFVDHLFELATFHYYLRKNRRINSILKKLYPDDIEFTSKRIYEIWEDWYLKDDFNDEIKYYATNVLFKNFKK